MRFDRSFSSAAAAANSSICLCSSFDYKEQFCLGSAGMCRRLQDYGSYKIVCFHPMSAISTYSCTNSIVTWTIYYICIMQHIYVLVPSSTYTCTHMRIGRRSCIAWRLHEICISSMGIPQSSVTKSLGSGFHHFTKIQWLLWGWTSNWTSNRKVTWTFLVSQGLQADRRRATSQFADRLHPVEPLSYRPFHFRNLVSLILPNCFLLSTNFKDLSEFLLEAIRNNQTYVSKNISAIKMQVLLILWRANLFFFFSGNHNPKSCNDSESKWTTFCFQGHSFSCFLAACAHSNYLKIRS